MSRILVIEDELAINKMLCLHLGLAGHETIPMQDGQQVLNWLEEGNQADLALVDVMLPKVDGFALHQPLTAHNIPVIYLTARGDLESRLRGLTNGAEDYVVKPFEILEVLARIENALTRHGRNQTVLHIGHVDIDIAKRSASVSGEKLNLTPIEFDLLLLLARNRNIALSRERMLHEVWNICYEGGTRTVDVHIAQLRKKTGLRVVSVPKIGYRLEVGE